WRGLLDEGRSVLTAAAERAEPSAAVVMLAEASMGAFYAADAAGLEECGARVRVLASLDGGNRTAFFGAIIEGMALVLSGAGGDRGAAALREAVRLVEHSHELRTDPRLLVWASDGPDLAARDRARPRPRRSSPRGGPS